MKTKKFVFVMLFASAFLSCSKQAAAVRNGVEPGLIVFTAEGEGIGLEAKATSAVTSLSSFNVNCITGTPGSSETSVFNSAFTGSTNYTGEKYWPSTDRGYKFYASNVGITPAATGPTVAVTNDTDVVCAVCSNPTYLSSNTLTFNHIFARLGATTVTVQNGYTLSAFTLKITPKTGGTYNLFTGNGKTDGTGWIPGSAGTEETIATSSGTNAATDIYLVPGKYELTANYTLTKGDYIVKKSSKKSVDISGGKINAISATLGGASAADITFAVSITPWGDPVNRPVEFNE